MCIHTKNIWRKNKPIAFGNANKIKQTKAFINAPIQVRKLSTQQKTKNHKITQTKTNKTTKHTIHTKNIYIIHKIIIDKLIKRARPTGLAQTKSTHTQNNHITNTKKLCIHTKKQKRKTKENTSNTLENAKKTTLKINETKASRNSQTYKKKMIIIIITTKYHPTSKHTKPQKHVKSYPHISKKPSISTQTTKPKKPPTRQTHN